MDKRLDELTENLRILEEELLQIDGEAGDEGESLLDPAREARTDEDASKTSLVQETMNAKRFHCGGCHKSFRAPEALQSHQKVCKNLERSLKRVERQIQVRKELEKKRRQNERWSRWIDTVSRFVGIGIGGEEHGNDKEDSEQRENDKFEYESDVRLHIGF